MWMRKLIYIYIIAIGFITIDIISTVKLEVDTDWTFIRQEGNQYGHPWR